MGLNNIAEGIVDIAIRHGIDPRDYSLVAYGAAGPMLLPALLDVIRVPERDRAAAPRPVLAPSACCRRTSSTPTAAAPTGARAPTPRARSTTSSRRWRTGCARSSATACEGVEFERSIDARLVGQTWETPFIEVPGGTIDDARDRDDDRQLPRGLRAAHRQPLRGAAGAGRDLPRAGEGADRQGRLPADRRRNGGAPDAGPRDHAAATSTARRSPPREYDRASCSPATCSTGPAIIREALSTT